MVSMAVSMSCTACPIEPVTARDPGPALQLGAQEWTWAVCNMHLHTLVHTKLIHTSVRHARHRPMP